MPIAERIVELLILAIPVATVAWTVTHEEIFREFREWMIRHSKTASHIAVRKLAYLFTCEFCFSFWVSAAAVAITDFRLLYASWRGFAVAWLSLVWVANVYMGMYARLKLDVKKERVELASRENAAARESHEFVSARE